MRILLAKCSRAYPSHFQENSESLALGYLASSLRAGGFGEVEVLDGALMQLPLSEMLRRIFEGDYSLIGFTISDVTYVEATFDCIRALRGRGAKALIVLGGYAPTFHYQATLQACEGIDAVVRFEGEETLLEVARCLRDGRDWRHVRGLAYRCKEGIKATDVRRAIRELDELPFPARDTLPFILEHMPATGVVSVSGSRGCYANCAFCSIRAFHAAQGGPPMRLRSVANVVDEIEKLVRGHALREIVLVDDVFTIPTRTGKRRIESFIEEFERRDLRVMLSISERAANVTEEYFVPLRQLGVRQVLIGIEAGTNDLLDYYNKKTTTQQNRRAIDVLHGLEIDPTVSCINFAPVTTLEQLRRNLAFLLSLRVNFLQGLLNRFQVYPETPLGQEMVRRGRVCGTFPSYEYTADDPRTDVAHRIATQSLGLFLTAAFELKRIERGLRHRLFDAEATGHALGPIRKSRSQFQDLQQGIMEDAGRLFESILDFAEACPSPGARELTAFVGTTRNTARERFREWLYQLTFFQACCPFLVRSVGMQRTLAVTRTGTL